ncbi:MAG: monoamine oxidase [Myxococcota bacterium]|jgi:monoamine oxidase
MNRRTFLASTLGAASVFILPRIIRQGSRKQSSDKRSPLRVIVVGAGVAGLAAAQELRSHGAIVRIVEASNVSGGRAAGLADLGMASASGIEFNTAVRRVSQTRTLVTLSTTHGELAADAAIVTVPPSLLATGQLTVDGMRVAQREAAFRLSAVLCPWSSTGVLRPSTREERADARRFSAPIGRVFFAGDATDPKGLWTADGARRSAASAASQLVETIGITTNPRGQA